MKVIFEEKLALDDNKHLFSVSPLSGRNAAKMTIPVYTPGAVASYS
jgi:hypothetical protein